MALRYLYTMRSISLFQVLDVTPPQINDYILKSIYKRRIKEVVYYSLQVFHIYSLNFHRSINLPIISNPILC